MKFKLSRETLLAPLKHLHGVVEARSTVPILSNVLVRAKDGIIEFAATDLELYVIERLEGSIEKEGTVTVDAHVFHDIVRKIPEKAEILVEMGEVSEAKTKEGPSGLPPLATEESLVLSAGSSRFALSTLSSEEFPTFDAAEKAGNFKIESTELRHLIERAQFSMSKDDMRSHLNGVFIHSVNENGNGLLRSVATDGHRLSRIEIPRPKGAEALDSGILLPSKALHEIVRLLNDFGGKVEVEVLPTKLHLKIGGVTLITRLLDGVFPDYGRVIPGGHGKPGGHDKTLTVPRPLFMGAVDRVGTLTDSKSKAIRFDISGNQLTVSARDPSRGGAEETLDVSFEGDEITIGFNAQYLLDVCTVASGKEITVQFGDSGTAVSILDSDDTGSLFVVMPLRV